MSASLKPLSVLAAIIVTTGQFLAPAGSVRAEDKLPVAADLVELAVTLPDVISQTKVLDAEMAEQQRLLEKGVITQSDIRRVRAEHEAAHQKLKLLRILIQAEHEVATLRLQFAESQRKKGFGGDLMELSAGRGRIRLLKEMVEMAKEPPTEGGAEAASQDKEQP